MGFLHGMVRAPEVIEGQLYIRVVDRPLENLAIHLEEGGPARFVLPHRPADGPLEGLTVYRALDSHEEAKLPLRTELTRFLRKPNV
ncbi:hypothetical protein A5708_08560 [Mycobacterium colombiense]|uniref:Uncharacterized protein n=1 Tax=Mycobacterium colombiense TaxID=339268 RepID=A0A1A2YDC9_9MYCO|nr:hypothetical protein A5708_08560 [Mycobacterium colombiense]